ncbi:hypothetical protein ACIPRD_16720 [Streptomyces sp. NPDC090108]|uniref:hypothetical protein n=1 Tax=Streptomyces sp. NPDC090108 TaxID=3365947 RepID=UPI00381F1680
MTENTGTAGPAAATGNTGASGTTGASGSGSPAYADCVLCGKPTEYPESHRGITLCPVCEWQEAQRTACSG